ncbi:non-ribosomal peptide synthetase [Aneurinibacillus terranovensis]|uniref:non-ribosomal peptide synthetase family protein n=1 Tax=Aneurinibacillus terranovensis TaxID=278991 RepID=UPI000417BAB9|nr:non-ribosomal peptide synthetase [Aneurinibacillus terranovensis]
MNIHPNEKSGTYSATAEQYWLTHMAPPLPVMEFPLDFSRSPVYEFAGQCISDAPDKSFLYQIKKVCRDKGINVNTLLLTAYFVWMYRLTNEEDMIIGIPSTGYKKTGEVTLIPLRVSMAGLNRIDEALSLVSQRVTEAAHYSDYAFDELADKLNPDKDAGRPPVYSTIFSLTEERIADPADLIWQVRDDGEQLKFKLTFNKTVFKAESVYRFIKQYKKILKAFIEDASFLFRTFDILTEQEHLLYKELNHSRADFPATQTLPGLFYLAADKHPNNIALSAEDGRMTYEDVNKRSNQLAHRLQFYGLKKGDFIGVFMERSLDTVVSLLGIMKAGGVYVPIDPEYPEDRARYMIQDSRISHVVTKRQHEEKAVELIAGNACVEKILCVDDGECEHYSADNVTSGLTPDDFAYVIYTSGSTGRPKGTLLSHRSVVNQIDYAIRYYDCQEYDIFTQFTSFSFDPSVCETFSALFSGARLHLLSPSQRVSIEEFTNIIEEIKVTGVLALPTAFFNQLASYLSDEDCKKLASVKRIVVGGEALTGSMVRLWQKRFGTNITIINAYGPTECTIMSTSYKISHLVPDTQNGIPIGRPVQNYEMYILDSAGQLCPVHVPGELYIGGEGLAQGYLNQPEKTAEAFIPHPFSTMPGARLYKTGDLVRLLADGNIEFISRKDTQVKIRGHRIEPGEIEEVLAGREEVQEAAVIAQKAQDGNNRLIAYYTTVDKQPLHGREIRDFLAGSLPGYMVPEQIIHLAAMPLSPTGKIDRKGLAAREIESAMPQESYAPPRNATEKLIAEAWEKVLGVKKVGIYDDFFMIGGHSLKVLRILVLVKPSFPHLKIQDFFRYRTVAELAEYAEKREPQESQKVQTAGETISNANLASGEWKVRDLAEPARITGAVSSGSKPENILLTGATGYLGAHILYELLLQTSATVYCLVRSSEGISGEERLTDTMRFYFGGEGAKRLEDRAVIVEGDLGKADLGLSPAITFHLHKVIDTIIHSGADVRHFGDSAQFDKVNTRGTSFLLDIARHKKGVHFHHISTISVPEELAESGQWGDFAQTGDFTYDVTLENGYTNSKLQAEKLVREAMRTGVPATIYRAGNLTCHSETGLFQRNMESNAFYRMIKAALLLGAAPSANWYVDVTPIDYASRAIVNLVHQSDMEGRTFHICNPQQLLYDEFIRILQSFGYDIQLMEADRYQQWLFLSNHDTGREEALQLAMAQLDGDGAKDSEYRYTCNETEKFLRGTGISCAKPDRQLLQLLVNYAVKTRYFPAANGHEKVLV